MRNKVTSAADAVSIIQDGDTVCTSGFVGVGTPNELLLALERRFLETGGPRDLTLCPASGPMRRTGQVEERRISGSS
jgi:propionate CoA-transferase